MNRPGAAGVVVSMFVVACGGGAGDDSSGPPEAWRLESDLVIGTGLTAAGAPGPTFGQVPSIAVDDDGRVWVLDAATREVVLVDGDGGEVRRIGGPGEGEGLFQSPRRLRLVGDVLWVEDFGAARWVAWDTAGSVLGTYALPSELTRGDADLTGQGLVGVVSRRDGAAVTKWAGRWRPESGGFVRVDSMAPPPVPDSYALQTTVMREGREVTLAFPLPLAHQPSAQPDPAGTGWIVVPGGGVYSVLRVAFDGDILQRFEREVEPVPLPLDERAEQIERLPPEIRDAQGDQVPTAYPPFERVVLGVDGRLWVVRRVAVEGGVTRPALDLFDADGTFLGEMGLPADLGGLWLHHAGADALWGVRRTAEGRPVLVRLRIVEGD